MKEKKGYHEQQYKHSQPVRVHHRGMKPFEDEIKGLNKGHALHLARQNWEGARIEPIENVSASPNIWDGVYKK